MIRSGIGVATMAYRFTAPSPNFFIGEHLFNLISFTGGLKKANISIRIVGFTRQEVSRN